jgi:hypothetical protein
MEYKFKRGDRARVLISGDSDFRQGDLVYIAENSFCPFVTENNVGHWANKNAGVSGCFNETELELVEEEENRIEEQSSDVCVSTTGALRYNSDKPQLSQIDPLFLIGLSDLMTISAKKYSKWNYAKGQNLTTVCDSMSRHLLSFLNGENDDKESGKSHLLHIAANCIIAYSTTERHLEKHPELDDRINKFLEGLSNE